MAIDPSGISKALSLVRPARIESVREFRGAQQFSIGRELQSPNLFPLATLEIVEKPTAVRTPNGLWIRCGHESLIHRLLADVGYLNGFTAFGSSFQKEAKPLRAPLTNTIQSPERASSGRPSSKRPSVNNATFPEAGLAVRIPWPTTHLALSVTTFVTRL